jgi:hypothetical protein
VKTLDANEVTGVTLYGIQAPYLLKKSLAVTVVEICLQ